jgi:hypothetical protein
MTSKPGIFDSFPRKILQRLGGSLLAFVLLMFLGEVFLRAFPPPDLHPFLGEQSPLAGNLVPDRDFGVGFASWEMLQKDNPGALGAGSLLSPVAAKPSKVWLVLGSSFGFELATRMRRVFPNEKILTLDRREKINVRMAQVKTLLEGGSRPDHIFLVLIRPDFTHLGEFHLEHQTANSQGGYVMQPRLPSGWLGDLTAQSRLVFTAWSRIGLHKDEPSFRHRQLSNQVPDSLRHDLDRMFAGLGQASQRHGVPITVIPIPEKRIVLRKEGFALEDTLVVLAGSHRVDCFDPRSFFLGHPRPEELYVPDGHLSEQGNQVVLRGLKKHLAGQDTVAQVQAR